MYKSPNKNTNKSQKHLRLSVLVMSIGFTLAGCSSDSDDDSSNEGYFQVYNASSNAPEVYLTVTDTDDEDDYTTYSGAEFADATSYISYTGDQYDIDLSWLDDDENLISIYQQETTLANEYIQLVVIADDITSPTILTYDIEVDDPTTEEDVFNVSFLNLHDYSGGIDLYISESDQSFNEAQLIGNFAQHELSIINNFELDSYVFYITAAGENDVLYQSESIAFSYTNQHIITIRENDGAGESPFTLDKLGNNASVTNYPDEFSEAQVRIYNAIGAHELLPDYQESLHLALTGLTDNFTQDNLTLGEFTPAISLPFGDYSIDLINAETNLGLLNNHLLTLNPNDNKTVFFYADEEIEENDDGDEETKLYLRSLVTENSNRDSIYDHQMNIINLVDDYSVVEFYFVRSNETIENADYSLTSIYASPKKITLYNNTYRVYAIASDGSSDVILSSSELILNEDSKEQFLLIEENPNSSTGFEMQFFNQQD